MQINIRLPSGAVHCSGGTEGLTTEPGVLTPNCANGAQQNRQKVSVAGTGSVAYLLVGSCQLNRDGQALCNGCI